MPQNPAEVLLPLITRLLEPEETLRGWGEAQAVGIEALAAWLRAADPTS